MPVGELQIPVGFAQHSITHQYAGYGRLAINVLGTQWDSAGESLATQASHVLSAWVTRIVPFMDTSVSVSRITSIGRDSLGVLNRNDSNVTGTSGSTAGAATTPNVALLVRKSSIYAGKAQRGRWYVAWCIEEGSVDETGQIAGATVAVYQAAFSALRTDLAALTSPSDLVLLHRTPKVGVAPPPTLVAALNVESRIATQRRRLRK